MNILIINFKGEIFTIIEFHKTILHPHLYYI